MKSTTKQGMPDKSKIAKMTGGAGSGVGRMQQSAAAPGKGAGKMGMLKK